jgi:hypothetical protein
MASLSERFMKADWEKPEKNDITTTQNGTMNTFFRIIIPLRKMNHTTTD